MPQGPHAAPSSPAADGAQPQVGAPESPATGRTPPGTPRPPDQWPTGRLFSAVARRIERDWNAHLAHWELNHASLPVLYLLAGGPRSQRELALASGVTEQTMSRIVVRLERTGYVRREAHTQDRRRHAVHLTDAGRVALQEAGDPQVAEQMSVRGLTPEQVTQLRSLLAVLLAQRPRHDDPHPDVLAAAPFQDHDGAPAGDPLRSRPPGDPRGSRPVADDDGSSRAG